MKSGAKNKTKHYEYDIALGFVAVSMDLLPALHTNLIGSLVVGCVAADEMPPKKKKRLDVAKQSAFLKDLESSLVAFDRDHGKIVLRRLNRTQYENTINAMSGWLHMVLDEELPPDAVGRAHRLLCRGGAKRSAYCPTTKT